MSVNQVWARELGQDRNRGSARTMYRILAAASMSGERRRQAAHPPRVIPELAAAAPGQVWPWGHHEDARIGEGDPGPRLRGTQHLLPLPAGLAHRDRRGCDWPPTWSTTSSPSKAAHPATCTPTAARRWRASRWPRSWSTSTSAAPTTGPASNDNPNSESQFKTMKYMPDYPAQFASIGEARAWMSAFAS